MCSVIVCKCVYRKKAERKKNICITERVIIWEIRAFGSLYRFMNDS